MAILDQGFSKRNIGKIITARDFRKQKGIRQFGHILPEIEKLEIDIRDRKLSFPTFQRAIKNGKPVYIAPDFYTDFAIRKLNDNLKRIFRILQADRSNLVSIIIRLLEENTPFHVVKTDIKSFYESVKIQKLSARIRTHGLLSDDSKYVFSHLLGHRDMLNVSGLARGLSLSATLAEIYLECFDSDVRRIPSVYFYGRFVDDIIVFCFEDPQKVEERLISLLPTGLQLRRDKTKILSFGFDKSKIIPIEFDYLGYRFKREKKSLSVTIASKKVRKMQSRLVYSFRDHVANPNFDLLADRVKFLTSNYALTDHASRTPILSGIFFSYYLADNALPELIHLDRFLHTLLSKKSKLSSKIGLGLSSVEAATLKVLSFRSGFEKRLTHQYLEQRVAEIRRCWEHV